MANGLFALLPLLGALALIGENGHLDHPKTEYTDQLFSFA